MDDCVLSFDCLLLVLQKSVLHGEFVQLTTIVNCLLATLLCFKVDISVDRISFLFEHSYIGLFFSNNFLDGLSLHIFVISWTECIQILVTLFSCSAFDFWWQKLIEDKSYATIDICCFQVRELFGTWAAWLDPEGNGDEFVLMGSEREGFGSKCELFGVVEAEEEVGKRLWSVVNDLDCLSVVSSELYGLRLDR